MSARLSIQALSELTGVHAGTIRAWEARYSALQPLRDENNNRRIYSHVDVEKVRSIKLLLDQGFRIGQIAELDTSELQDILKQNRLSIAKIEKPEVFEVCAEEIQKSVNYLNQYDFENLQKSFVRARYELSFLDYISDYIGTLYREVDERLLKGQILDRHIKYFYNHLKMELFRLLSDMPHVASSSRPRFLVAGAKGHHKEVNIMRTHIVNKYFSLNSYYLGPDMAAESVADEVNNLDIDALLIGFADLPSNYQTNDVIEYLRTIERSVKKRLKVIVCGVPIEFNSTMLTVRSYKSMRDYISICQNEELL